MSAGFVITVRVNSPEELTPRKMALELYANGQLNESESEKLLPALVESAKALMVAFGEGPFVINLEGIDGRTQGERCVVNLNVQYVAKVQAT